ncbi:hypothetical protein QUA71_06890 [Microcoleus sp. MON1_C5]
MKIKLNKSEQALALLPGCKGVDRLVLYASLEKLGYRWSVKAGKWSLMR